MGELMRGKSRVCMSLLGILAMSFGILTASAGASTRSLTSVTTKTSSIVTLNVFEDTVVSGVTAWLNYGDASGIFAKNGFYVNVIFPGSLSPLEEAQEIAKGQVFSGSVGGAAMIVAQANGAPIKAFFGVDQKEPEGVLVRADSGITKGTQLAGKTIGVSPTSSSATDFPVYLHSVGLTESNMNIESLSQATLVSSLISGSIQGALVYPAIIGPEVQAAGVPTRTIPFDTDPAFDQVYNAFPVDNSYATHHAHLMKAVVRGFIQALQATHSHPGLAAAAEIQANPLVAPSLKVTTEQVAKSFDFVRAPNGANNPYGYMSKSNWAKTEAFAKAHDGLTVSVGLASIFTDAYFPKGK